MNKEKENIVVLGAGESGVGAAILAKAKGFDVFVSDAGIIKPNFKDELNEHAIPWEEGGHTMSRILNADEVIKSPGIPNSSELIQQIRANGVIPICDIEFAARYTNAKLIAITGSNGKTTTTHLVHHVLKAGELAVEMAGNVGVSFARCVLENRADFYVLELSSFQLEDMYDFKADIAILLNITPDHLDRYNDNILTYGRAKMRIINNQSIADAFIYNADDEQIKIQLEKHVVHAKRFPFSLTNTQVEGGFYKEEEKTISIKNKLTMSIHDLALKGKHNVQNSLVAGITGKLVGIRKESIRESLSDFTNVEHRLEFVAKVNGIEFINDSKATNINATWFALESMNNPTVWVVGGVDKGNDYEELLPLVQEKVKAIICLGKDNSKIIEAFADVVDTIVETQSPVDAVGYGYQLAKKDDTVLLSPACASFDLFENYEDRGQQFKNAVRSL
ncbi:UDP-N-acetylmuramoyl-L-alanine--D-glutamate ligase [Brumimicrobium salinarum]|uniref:UDP-N-acetylmuramoylalanine--D-glutamate ligase n=1 Tax=Brumimicrobium salinarum TaxID=2058658 RepID=A0A2I0QZU7_9FLAO|nr:UDP-N-acetylmuramoyl-L-alanine--D-glutamate ligase [Brumimicrobium salinarum]PKR79837.1 UDP-N-acetylmuramoyl-L-alanine--D-glutamate ligase [Brumimicrobium salinarum]